MAVGDELLLRKERMDFNLVDRGRDAGNLEKLLEVGNGEVGDTDGTAESLVLEGLERPPGGRWVLGQSLLDDVLQSKSWLVELLRRKWWGGGGNRSSW